MSIQALVYGRLAEIAGAIVGSRIYPLILPQPPTYEAITYQRISSSGTNGSTALRESRWQINCWAATYLEAHTLANTVKAGLEEWKNTTETPGVKQAVVVNELDDFEETAGNKGVYRVIIDVILTTTGD